jgi:hypothetical protein
MNSTGRNKKKTGGAKRSNNNSPLRLDGAGRGPQMNGMQFIRPFLAGSFAAAAALRAVFTLLVDLGAGSIVEALGLARITLLGEFGIGIFGGLIFAVYAIRRPLRRGKKA